MNPSNILPDNDLRTAAPSLAYVIRRQSAGAEIPFLIAKIPFRAGRSLEYRQTSVHPRSSYTAGSTADLQVSRVASRGLQALLLPTSRELSRGSRRLVPGGHLTIAQRFIAGNMVPPNEPSPVGTDEGPANFNRPYGTRFPSGNVIPAINRRAILTCPYGASPEIWVIARLEARVDSQRRVAKRYPMWWPTVAVYVGHGGPTLQTWHRRPVSAAADSITEPTPEGGSSTPGIITGRPLC